MAGLLKGAANGVFGAARGEKIDTAAERGGKAAKQIEEATGEAREAIKAAAPLAAAGASFVTLATGAAWMADNATQQKHATAMTNIAKYLEHLAHAKDRAGEVRDSAPDGLAKKAHDMALHAHADGAGFRDIVIFSPSNSWFPSFTSSPDYQTQRDKFAGGTTISLSDDEQAIYRLLDGWNSDGEKVKRKIALLFPTTRHYLLTNPSLVKGLVLGELGDVQLFGLTADDETPFTSFCVEPEWLRKDDKSDDGRNPKFTSVGLIKCVPSKPGVAAECAAVGGFIGGGMTGGAVSYLAVASVVAAPWAVAVVGGVAALTGGVTGSVIGFGVSEATVHAVEDRIWSSHYLWWYYKPKWRLIDKLPQRIHVVGS